MDIFRINKMNKTKIYLVLLFLLKITEKTLVKKRKSLIKKIKLKLKLKIMNKNNNNN